MFEYYNIILIYMNFIIYLIILLFSAELFVYLMNKYFNINKFGPIYTLIILIKKKYNYKKKNTYII